MLNRTLLLTSVPLKLRKFAAERLRIHKREIRDRFQYVSLEAANYIARCTVRHEVERSVNLGGAFLDWGESPELARPKKRKGGPLV